MFKELRYNRLAVMAASDSQQIIKNVARLSTTSDQPRNMMKDISQYAHPG